MDPIPVRPLLPFTRQERFLLGFTAIYLIPAIVAAARKGNAEFVMYVAVIVVLMGLVLALHRRVGLHAAALWGLSLWGLAHMAGGLMPIPDAWPASGQGRVLYNWWILPGLLKYDQAVHAFGFGLTTWICWQSLRSAFRKRGVELRPTFGLLVLCVAAGIGFGALNEVVEFIATRILPETNVGGYENTGWDLVANLAGATIAAIWIAIADRDRSIPN